ncbi:MAG: hypothetical protein GC139_05290 [Sideroxydans sp.]|nr:hypothetical protein [Sideroxydans sp.]
MLRTLRREYAHLVTSGAQLLLLIVGLKLESRVGWVWVLGIMTAISLFAWLSALRRLRLVRDTPTSRIASAAQGYAELIGRGKQFNDPPLLGKLSLLPCLWYRYKIERKDSKNEWRTEESGESAAPFMLEDDSGRCIVNPDGAEILTMHKDTWQRGTYRYTEWKLLDIDTIYAIGQFRTFGGSSTETTTKQEMNAVLAEWKQDMPSLHQRFDLNNDGQLDMQEWMLARQAARREAKKRVSEAHVQPDTHYLLQPHDQRLFLISNLPQNKLERRYWFWTWAHLIIFFGTLGALSWLLGNPLP